MGWGWGWGVRGKDDVSSSPSSKSQKPELPKISGKPRVWDSRSPHTTPSWCRTPKAPRMLGGADLRQVERGQTRVQPCNTTLYSHVTPSVQPCNASSVQPCNTTSIQAYNTSVQPCKTTSVLVVVRPVTPRQYWSLYSL